MVKEKEPKVSPTRWISLKQASLLLGVNPSTLRRWADARQVKTFRTPGGHRRFSEADLQALMAGERPQAVQSYQTLTEATEQRLRRRLGSQESAWMGTVRGQEREGLLLLRRRLLEVVAQYLSRRTRRGRLREEAREIGGLYGRELVASGVSLHDGLEGFAVFRRALLESTLETIQKGGLPTGDLAEASAQVAEVADASLLAMMEAFLPPNEGVAGVSS